MAEYDLPRLNRDVPKPMAWLFTILLYGFMAPLNGIMVLCGGKPLVVRTTTRFRNMQELVRQALDDYTPTAHDVFVNTYAKSGTNWMMQIAYQVAFKGEGEFANVYDVVPWPEMHAQWKGKFLVALDDERVRQASPTGMRVIKTHLAAKYLPYSDQAKYITVIRDPKDVFVSSYHFQAEIYGPLMPSVDAWLDTFLSTDFPIGFGSSWAGHTAGNWALRDKPNVLVVSFRDMKQDLPATVRRVANLMNVPLSPGEEAAVIEKSEFAYMKAIDDCFFPINTKTLPWCNVSMVRSGKDGAAAELLSPAQQRRIDTHFIAELKALDSDFPYEEFCRVSY